MPRNGSGTYIRTDGVRTGSTVFAQEDAAGINIEATNLDTEAQDMADALTQSLSKDGQTVPTENLPMGGFKLTGLANGSATADSAAYGQVANLAMGLEWKTGLLVSNNVADATNDIDVAVGSIMDTNNAYRMNLTSAFTKRIDATFAAGSGNGGCASGNHPVANDTWLGVFMVSKSTNTSDSDIVFATTKALALASTGVTGVFDIARLIGYVRRGTAANLAFKDGGDDWYIWDVMIDAVITQSPTAVSTTVRVPPYAVGRFNYNLESTAAAASVTVIGLISSLTQTDSVPTNTLNSLFSFSGAAGAANTSTGGSVIQDLKVSSASQIRHRETAAANDAQLMTIGWKFLPTVTDLV